MSWRGLGGCILGLGLSGFCFGQLTSNELQGLEESLYLGNFSLKDLQTNRTPFREMKLSEWVRDGMGDPVKSVDVLMRAHRTALGSDVPKIFTECFGPATGIELPKSPPVPKPVSGETTVDGPLTDILLPLAETMTWADAAIRDALSKLKPAEQRLLIESLALHSVDEPRVKIGFVKDKPADIAQVVALMARVDMSKIEWAGLTVEMAANVAVGKLKAAKLDTVGKQRYVVNGLPVIVGGVGSDLHDEVDARITIDLGGRDMYRGRHGAGVGYSSVLIDLGGDDDYRVQDLSIGAAILGVGIAIDMGGDDRFEGNALNFGVGIGGFGVLEKSSGDDVYKSVGGSQGFGLFGAGILLDTGGDDLYKIGIMGQGAGRTQGLGWLIDRKGNDLYQAGGLVLNQPLFDDVYYSNAQGFGEGYRDDAGGVPGGVGMLSDGAGTDNYLAETYCQAASYWFSVGSLFDASGNDSYRAHHYAQASSMHFTSAYLFDLAGADAYVTQYGAAQGIGHDNGLAFFLDRAGNDVYASRDARPGTGVSNGIGIFIESAGIDRYATAPGFASVARSMMSLGLFVELDGADLYPDGFADGVAQVQPAVVIRNDFGGGLQTAPPVAPKIPTPGSKPKPSEAELKRLYDVACGWQVGSSAGGVDEAINELIAIGMPGFDWMVKSHLATINRLEVRAWARITNAIGIDAIAALGRRGLQGSDAELEGVIRIGNEGRIADIGALLPNVIKNKPKLRDLAMRTAGTLKARGCTEVILPILFNADDYTKRVAIAALADIGDAAAVGTAANYVSSPDPFVRDAAVRLILTSPEQAYALGKVLIQDVDEQKARMGVLILGRLDMFNSLDSVAQSLTDPRPGVRISALLALNGRCPANYREAFVDLIKDPIPTVARVARQVKP
ncbi:MAG: hypothetical protein ACKVQS_09525 [Fimbriimonadaceae bacterium]